VLRLLVALYAVVTVVLPVFGLVIVSFERFWTARIPWSHLTTQNYTSIFSNGAIEQQALRTSIILAIVGATVCVGVSAVVSYFARRNGMLGGFSGGTLKIPGAVSHIVLGLAFLVAFTGAPFQLQGTLLLLLLAYVVVYLPQASIAADSAIAQVGSPLEEAAAVGGAGSGRTFGRVTLPLMLPGLLAGWAVVFVLMAGDFNVSQFLASPKTPVVSFALVDRFTSGTFPAVAALGVAITIVNVIIVSIVMVIAQRLQRRRS
jgi:iron(III) transport system permease protein